MIIRILLTIFFIVLGAYNYRSSIAFRTVKFSLYLVSGFGIFFVWNDDLLVKLANVIGVGRATDLVFYLSFCLNFYIFLNLHLKIRELRQNQTKLVRELATLRAQETESLN